MTNRQNRIFFKFKPKQLNFSFLLLESIYKKEKNCTGGDKKKVKKKTPETHKAYKKQFKKFHCDPSFLS